LLVIYDLIDTEDNSREVEFLLKGLKQEWLKSLLGIEILLAESTFGEVMIDQTPYEEIFSENRMKMNPSVTCYDVNYLLESFKKLGAAWNRLEFYCEIEFKGGFYL